jgi:hypothetical protein
MKTRIVLSALMLLSASTVLAQQANLNNDASIAATLKEKGTLVTGGGASSLRGDFTLDVSEDFAADLKLKISIPDNENWELLLTNSIGSTNQYTPLISEGKWALDNTLGLEANWHFWTRKSVFDTDLKQAMKGITGLSDNKAIRKAAFNQLETQGKLSRYSTVWLSAGAKWTYEEFQILKDSLYASINDPFDAHQVNGALFSVGLNGLHVTSVRQGIQFNWLFKYAFQLNGTNYLDLGKVEANQSNSITDTLGNILTTSGPTTKGRRGKLDKVDTHVLFAELHAVWTPSDKFGVDFFVMPTLSFIGKEELLKIRSGVNFAVPGKDGKSLANIGLAVDINDATTPFVDADDRKNRIIPTLMVGVPIPDIKKK